MPQRGYLCFDRYSSKIIVNRHVVFNEGYFPYNKMSSHSSESSKPSVVVSILTTFPATCPLPIEQSHLCLFPLLIPGYLYLLFKMIVLF